MDDRAVQAFGEILKHQLPIGVHVVVDATGRPQARDVEAAEPTFQGSERARERLRLLRQSDEQEPFPLGERDLVERVVPLVEPRDLVHVRRADQRAIERVGPRVVGALNRLGKTSALRLAQPGAAVAAHIVEGAHRAVLTAHDDDALAAGGADRVVPGLGELGGAADADPAPREDALPLFGPDLGRVVVAPGQRPLALLVRLGGFDERRHGP